MRWATLCAQGTDIHTGRQRPDLKMLFLTKTDKEGATRMIDLRAEVNPSSFTDDWLLICNPQVMRVWLCNYNEMMWSCWKIVVHTSHSFMMTRPHHSHSLVQTFQHNSQHYKDDLGLQLQERQKRWKYDKHKCLCLFSQQVTDMWHHSQPVVGVASKTCEDHTC